MATAEIKKPIKVPCRECNIKTLHDILCESTERGDEDYDFYSTYQVIQCRGCQTKGFRHYSADYEQGYPVSETEWEFPETSETYPKFDSDHRPLDNMYEVPDVVRSIYFETRLAIKEDALTLASLGLRGTVEAICNDLKITGSNLASRITKLSSQGLISKKDAERLHAIRFLGNDAAHEIKKPKRTQITVAVKIIDHLINSIYLLEKEADGSLETAVGDFDQFTTLLKPNLAKLAKGDELPLAAILGRDVRRLVTGPGAFESQLISQISAGAFPHLALGKVAKYANSKEDLQHFTVQ